MTGKLVIIQPSDSPGSTLAEIVWDKSISPDLSVLQKHVGGYIERVRVRWEGKVRDAYVNEDGLSAAMPVNVYGTSILAPPFVPGVNVLVGNVVIWVPDARKGPKRVAPDGSVSS